MVRNVTSYTGSGLLDWLVQRITSLILASYVMFFMAYFLIKPEITYQQWESLFSHTSIKVATLVTLLALVLHAWIGVWTILTDYIKPYGLRLFIEILAVIALISYVVWGVILVWSV